jgi:hypothetical protein
MSQTPFDKFEERPVPKDLKHWRNAFDSRYLRHFWLNGKPQIVTIAKVEMLKSSNKRDSKQQLLVSLAEAEKKWAINVTNCGIIESLSKTSDPNGWIGLRIELYVTKTRDPSGAMVDCIRVRDQLPAEGAKTVPPKRRQEVNQYLHEMKEAKTLEVMDAIMDRVVEDNALSTEETELLLDGNKRRRAQIVEGK